MSSLVAQRCIVLGEDIGKGIFFAYRLHSSTSPHLVLLCCDPGGSFSSGEPQRDAVHVVSDRMCTRIQKHEQVWRGPQEVSRDRKGEQSFSGTLLCVVPCLGFLFGFLGVSLHFWYGSTLHLLPFLSIVSILWRSQMTSLTFTPTA